MRETGLGYEAAHNLTNRVEQEARDHPERLSKLLERERQRMLRIQKMMAADSFEF